MAYLVLARKYRPQRFGEMSGQAHVVRTLSNALKSGQLAHAFLFTGPRGVGKTTTARLVAKALNCEQGPTPEPCGVCVPCTEIAEGRCVDVTEIDAASNNGVDNVRDIVEAVKYRPARDRFKVFVIDEVHMLSQGAFNALLKTLEEPPPHVKFVLATTDVHKVPETIVSRCQRFDFRRLTLQQIADQLGHVARAEGMTLSPGALGLVARAAEGGMRDALSLLDRVRAACGDAPADADVAEALGTIDVAAVSRMAGALLDRDGAALLAEIAVLHERGLEMKRVAEELSRHLRNVVVARLAPAAPLDLPDAELAEVKAQAAAADPAQLTRLFDLTQRAVVDCKLAEQPRHALEVALLKAVFLAPGAGIAELISRVEALAAGAPLPPSGGGGPGPASGRPSPRPAAPAPIGMGRTLAPVGTPGCAAGPGAPAPVPPAASPAVPAADGWTALPADGWTALPADAVAPIAAAPIAAAPSALPPPPAAPLVDPAAGVGERWRQVVDAVEQVAPMAGPALRQATLLWLREGEVAIQLPAGMLATGLERKRADLEAVFARCLGRPTRLRLELGAAPPAGAVPGEAAPVSIAAEEAAEKLARSHRVREAARNHPHIKEAARILEGGLKIEEL
jgi:DNA polymerase-3 subunit gamma/tau